MACLCQFDPYGFIVSTTEPNATDVVGTYVLTKQTLISDGLDFLQGEQTKITVFSDGTFKASDFPIWEESDVTEYKLNQLVSVSGKWSIEIVGGVSFGGNDVRSVWGLAFTGTIPSASFTGKKSPFGLLFTYGDPDSGKVMIFNFEE
jgi:hypothetical protein